MSTLQCINAQHVKKSFNHPTDLIDTLKLLIQGVEHRGNAQINEAHDFLINKFSDVTLVYKDCNSCCQSYSKKTAKCSVRGSVVMRHSPIVLL